MIVIISNPDDEHVSFVSAKMQAMNIPFVQLYPQDMARRLFITLSPLGTSQFSIPQSSSNLERVEVCFDEVSALWYRRPLETIFPPEISGPDADFANGEVKQALRGAYRLLGAKRWLNTPDQIELASSKPEQLERASQCGLTIPATIISNDVTECLSFCDKVGGNVVYKGLSGYTRKGASGEPFLAIFTTPISRSAIESRRNEISLAPCIFQEYVSKEYEIRVTVVGKEVFAARIDSQKSKRSSIDWRHYDLANTPYLQYRLPSAVERGLLSLLGSYNLDFATIDLIRTPDGRYYFLDLNPNGQWLWIETLTGLPISDAVISYLTFRDHTPQWKA